MRPTNSKATCVALVIAVLTMLAFAAPALAEKAPFGLKFFEISATEAPLPGQEPDVFGRVQGPADLQAGSHPYKLTTSFVLNKPEYIERSESFVPAGRGLRDVQVKLPPGFVGNPNATPKCNYHDFINDVCPNDTVVGVETTVLGEPKAETGASNTWRRNPVYNLETPGGVPAEFGYYAAGVVPIFLDASVRTGSDYGITASVRNIPQVEQVWASTVTIWGVPGESSHDPYRGTCLSETARQGEGEPGEGLWAANKPYVEEVSKGSTCPA